MINSFAIHTTGQVLITANSIATAKISFENISNGKGAFVVEKIIGNDTLSYLKFKISCEPGSNLLSEDFISLTPFSSGNTYTAPNTELGYSRKNKRPIFLVPAGSTMNIIFKNEYNYDITSCIGFLGFYVNEKGQRINDGNIPAVVLNRLL